MWQLSRRILSKFLGFRQIWDCGAAPKEATAASRASYICVISTKISGHGPYKFRSTSRIRSCSISVCATRFSVCKERHNRGVSDPNLPNSAFIEREKRVSAARFCPNCSISRRGSPPTNRSPARPLGAHCRIKTNKGGKTHGQFISRKDCRCDFVVETRQPLSPAPNCHQIKLK